ncbi:hypothetical protein [Bacillus luti]|uniref:Uncharacterized protein n=1 Tax=Bacillus luti TaxID=2026191 RepID=A0A7V7S860_9BACI|nr:hypothetical protein [Bacillus luti]KAB2443262.1 hypothetical protein F8163_09270 [Bacillus luti]
MCTECSITNYATVGSVVQIVRRCNNRTPNDKGRHLALMKKFVLISRIGSTGEAIYGHIINNNTGTQNSSECHFRDCEFVLTPHKMHD